MKALLVLALLLLLGGAGATAFVYSGLYNISATDQHLAPTYYTLQTAMRHSVQRRARDIAVPPLGAPEQLSRGGALYRAHCEQCHGGPGAAPEPFALGLTPLATPLQRSALERTPAELYWVVRNGIKMTAMPAWQFRLDDADLWALVAFTRTLPLLSPGDYAALPRAPLAREGGGLAPGEPDLARGRKALEQYACVACHQIPGMVGPEARLGPTLHGIGARGFIGGVLPNSPANMARWLLDPKAYSPNTAMPALGVTERDARDMAAYLATLK